jgi:hypothetical protein
MRDITRPSFSTRRQNLLERRLHGTFILRSSERFNPGDRRKKDKLFRFAHQPGNGRLHGIRPELITLGLRMQQIGHNFAGQLTRFLQEDFIVNQ